jgi:ABC-type lipoprotein export system ATPase subunit
MGKKFLELKNINKKYIHNGKEIVVLNNVSLNFEKGKFYAIIGSSGCGKTTLINILGTIGDFSSGEYFIDGENISNYDDNKLSKLRYDNIGYIFQDFYLNNYLTALENVMLPLTIDKKLNKNDRLKKSVLLLDKVGLLNRRNHFPKELSGGEQQRVCIARALANDPNIILADEPTGNLDKKNEKRIFEILNKLKSEDKCIIVVSHSSVVKKYADVVYEIKNGKVFKHEK